MNFRQYSGATAGCADGDSLPVPPKVRFITHEFVDMSHARHFISQCHAPSRSGSDIWRKGAICSLDIAI